MSDETVEVPVELLTEWADQAPHIVAANIRSYIPKPKPRIVAVNLGDVKIAQSDGTDPEIWMDALHEQLDLLDVLDGVIDGWWLNGRMSSGVLKRNIRDALGVSDET